MELLESPALRYGFDVGDVVCHIKDMEVHGVVTEIDAEHDLGDVTTCRVVWDVLTLEKAMLIPKEDQDIQWTNKLVKVETI